MDSEHALHAIPDHELLRRLGELVCHSRRVEADLVAHIDEVDERRLYAREASPSMFAYCTERLHLSAAEAYMRIAVARAARKHAVLLAMLRDGRLHLSGIAMLAPLLTRDNFDAVLARATHRSKRQLQELVAELSPRADAPSMIRKLPQKRQATFTAVPEGNDQPRLTLGPRGEDQAKCAASQDQATLGTLQLVPDGITALELAPDGVTAALELVPDGVTPGLELVPDRVIAALVLGPDRVGSLAQASAPALAVDSRLPLGPAPTRPPSPSRPAVVEPLSPARYKVQFTASAEFHDKLKRLSALMHSEVLDGDLAAIIEQAVTEKLERLEARRYAQTGAPRKRLADTDTSPATRHIPAAVRRAVRERDGDRCRYVDEQGRRCSAHDRFEFHHRHPFGMGGDHSLGNIRLLCSTHNQYLAEHDYGHAAINRHRRLQKEAPA